MLLTPLQISKSHLQRVDVERDALLYLTKKGRSREEVSLDLGVESKHKSTTGSSDDVGERSLEESSGSFVSGNLGEAVQGTIVHLLGSSRVHHESSSDGIEWVRDDTSRDSDDLGEGPHGEDGCSLGIWEEYCLTSIEHTEIGGTVSDDTNDGDTESSVESLWSILHEDLSEAVDESSELSVSSGTDVSSETGSGEIEWVDDAERSGSSSSTRCAVSDEEHSWLLLWIIWTQSLLVEVLESEVQSLGWEVTNDIGQVSSPECDWSLLSEHSNEAITNTVVSVLGFDGG